MFRTSSYLAIALSATAIATATTPAAAMPSQVFGGGANHLVAEFHPAPAVTTVQPSQQVSHLGGNTANYPPKIPQVQSPGVSTTVGSIHYPIPHYPGVSSVVKNLEVPIAELPAPKPHLPIDNVCPDNPLKCAPHPQPPQTPQPPVPPQQSHPQPYPGPVVIVTPPVQAPGSVPYGVPARVASAPSYIGTAQPRSSAAPEPTAPQCGAPNSVPALAAGIDELLPSAQLSQDDMGKVISFRQMIQDLATDGKIAAARDVEEVAMSYLGYQKIWLQCGPGAFAWAPVPVNDAAQATAASVAQPAVQSR